MFFDWLAREGWIVLNWWLLITLAGAAVLPLCMRLLGGLPDRGYTLARTVGLLLVGFTFWLLASLGFLRNSTGSILLSWLIMLGVSVWLYRQGGDRGGWRAWWQENRRLVIVTEVLFAFLLFGWALFRAHQNNLTGTEKPMELAFLSAVQRSETFPPNDPWMSGYAISYYYLGYVQSTMLSMVSGIGSTIGFNMTNAALFALTGLTSFGVAYNLVESRAFRSGGIPVKSKGAITVPSQRTAVLVGLLAVVFVVLMGNFQAVLIEAPYQSHSVSEDYLRFWGTQERTFYPEVTVPGEESQPNFFEIRDPTQWSSWWWFRASRVLTDYELNGEVSGGAQPIDEFPQFSFLLADNHPHVLALPFAVLALGLALNLLLMWRDPTRIEIIFYGLCLGGLVFLNTWDGPIYMLALVGADALRRLMRSADGRLYGPDWIKLVQLGAWLALVTLVAYAPFFIGFRSQASGLLPNLIQPTLFRRYFIMFGPFVLILTAFVGVEIWRSRRDSRMNWALGMQVVAVLFLVLVGSMFVLTFLGLQIPQLSGPASNFIAQNGGLGSVLPTVMQRRVTHGLLTVSLLAGIGLVVGRLFPRPPHQPDQSPRAVTYPAATGFALLLVGMGLVLSLVPEFVYLRDNFGTRINTIFKFYYQTWVVFSLAAAYAVYTILADFRLPRPTSVVQRVFGVLLVVSIAAGMVYPILGIHNRMFIENGRAFADNSPPLTLDGGQTLISANDYGAIMCLNQAETGADATVAEAVGPAYNSGYGRVGALTGIPIVLGWENHERQWRGPTYGEVAGTRAEDIRELYTDLRWDVAQRIIDQYSIDYVLFGDSERASYGTLGEEKFIDNLAVVCEQGSTRIYRVGSQAVAEANLR